jgi:hypothetical protein
MSQWRRKPDPFKAPTSSPMNIDEIWKAGQSDDGTLKPPKPNLAGEVPYTRLVHHIDDLDNLSLTIPIDRGTVELIQRKTAPFVSNHSTRQQVELKLMTHDGEVFSVQIWIIPIYSDGILVHHVFAADDTNQELLRQHRNPVKPSEYDITSL